MAAPLSVETRTEHGMDALLRGLMSLVLIFAVLSIFALPYVGLFCGVRNARGTKAACWALFGAVVLTATAIITHCQMHIFGMSNLW